jgi:putative acetyltransferase
MSFLVRDEAPADRTGVGDVLRAAFGRSSEVDLVERLRARGDGLSFVAVADGRIVGHAIFVPVEVVGARGCRSPLALALLCVHPTWQARGIGSLLVRRGLEACRRTGAGLVFVIGAAAFYRRFGFAPAPPLGIRCRWRVPDESFRVLELVPGQIERAQGVVRYGREFSAA